MNCMVSKYVGSIGEYVKFATGLSFGGGGGGRR